MFKNKTNQVYTDVELGVNYVTHIYTIAEAGFEDKDYLTKYGDTISIADKEYLNEHSRFMSFTRKDHGPFAGQLFFIPSYFNMRTKKNYENYFQAWIQAIKEKSFLYLEKYQCFNHDYREMFKADSEKWEKILEIEPIYNRIGKIYVDNIENYCNNVWPEIRPWLLKKSQELNKKIEKNLILKWEKITGYKFKKDAYCILLFYAGANGPSFNNLSLDKNTAFYNYNEKYMLDMISHELGIHILLPYLSKAINKFERNISRINNPEIYGNVSYIALESLATFYNMEVFNRETMDIHSSNDYNKFSSIYSELYHINLDPLSIYEKGVEEYIKDLKVDYESEDCYFK